MATLYPSKHHGRFKDLTGAKFGRLTVLERVAGPRGKPTWRCRCQCEALVTVLGENLRSGNTRSCGCLQREKVGALRRTHGQSSTPAYAVWQEMLRRCYTPRCRSYHNYGGRGITVCDRWREDFAAFLADMGPCPAGYTLERRDNDGPYSPANCYWASRAVQARNTRRNVYVSWHGETLTIEDWAHRLGMLPSTLQRRFALGWSVGRALTAPVDTRRQRKATRVQQLALFPKGCD